MGTGDVTSDITLTMILFAVGYVVQQGVVILWLRSDLKKHESTHRAYVSAHAEHSKGVREDLGKLFGKSEQTMTRKETTDLIHACIGELRGDIKEIKETSRETTKSVNNIRESLIRIDERHAFCPLGRVDRNGKKIRTGGDV